MKRTFIILICTLIAVIVRGQVVKDGSLILIPRSEFEKGTLLSKKRVYDKNTQKKTNGMLVFSSCQRTFKDDTTDEGFVRYDHVGDLDRASDYKVVKETRYNGETYYIINAKLNCRSVHLLGEPQVLDDLLVNGNESETTDRKPIIEIWKIEKDGIKKIASVNLSGFIVYLDVSEFRVSNKHKLLFKNFDGRYWQLNYNN